MADKNILAFFKDPKDAEAALAAVKGEKLELIDSQIKDVDGYPGDGSDQTKNPITGDIPGLGYLTLGGDFTGRNAGILAASSVSASGMSSGGPDNRVSGHNILLTLVVSEHDYERAMEIVQQAGAVV